MFEGILVCPFAKPSWVTRADRRAQVMAQVQPQTWETIYFRDLESIYVYNHADGRFLRSGSLDPSPMKWLATMLIQPIGVLWVGPNVRVGVRWGSNSACMACKKKKKNSTDLHTLETALLFVKLNSCWKKKWLLTASEYFLFSLS